MELFDVDFFHFSVLRFYSMNASCQEAAQHTTPSFHSYRPYDDEHKTVVVGKEKVFCVQFFLVFNRFWLLIVGVCECVYAAMRLFEALYLSDISYEDLWRLLHVIDIFIEDKNH